MNPRIDPDVARTQVENFLEEIDDKNLIEKDYREGSEELVRIIKEIEGLLKAMFEDYKKRISPYHPRYIYVSGMRVDYQDRYIKKVNITKNNLLSLKKELDLYIASKVEDKKTNTSESDSPKLYIEKVENFGLGDVNYYNTTIYLTALISAIEESDDIPPEEKKNLSDKVKEIANNPYVSGIGAGLIVEGLKAASMGLKPF